MYGHRVLAERIGLAAKARLSNDLHPKFDLNGQRLGVVYTHSHVPDQGRLTTDVLAKRRLEPCLLVRQRAGLVCHGFPRGGPLSWRQWQ
jgi:hypothetical protein